MSIYRYIYYSNYIYKWLILYHKVPYEYDKYNTPYYQMKDLEIYIYIYMSQLKPII